jgi:hypothetical protein
MSQPSFGRGRLGRWGDDSLESGADQLREVAKSVAKADGNHDGSGVATRPQDDHADAELERP